MRNTTIHVGSAHSSANTQSSDGNLHPPTCRGRKEDKSRRERRGTDVKTCFTPVVKVLLLGVILSFLNVLFIIKHLEEVESELELV